MIKPGWTYHLTRLAAGSLVALVIGWWSGQLVIVPALFLATYLAWQFYNSLRLYKWLQSWDSEPPESLGMWAEIFDRIAALQKQNRKRSRQFQDVIDDFEGMADAFPDATLVIDSHDVISWFNDSAVQLLDLKTPLDRGQAVTNLIREPAFADWLSVQDIMQSSLDIICPSDDNIILQISAVRFRKNQRLLIFRNITDVHNLDRIRHDLVANVSHELRTPLTVILGYLEILKARTDEINPEAIERMYDQATQMHALLEDLLELSRLQDAEKPAGLEIVDIPAMLAQLEEQAADLSKGRHGLRFEVAEGLNLYGVETDLKSAFQNLLVNAINYTAAGGKIMVNWQQADDGLVLSVKDNGIGIPRRDIPRITERFYRVGDDRNRKSGGTGLGLAIVKHVLISHAAKLEIVSTPGKGSEFRCIFPADRKA
ncbi:MAG: phosphate regulon sensor histidine kinase PhoR [Xanthomonadales bacterium]|nr:phosphate regulon sensor histidine kinase PhoR [Xanthomonadales bacterium]